MEFEGRARISHHLNIAPLVDVVFLLLVFFMLTSTFLVTDIIDLELPDSSSARPAQDTDIVILLGADGQLAINGERVERERLEATLRVLIVSPATQLVTLKTDAEETVQEMIEIMDAIRASGAEKIYLATDREQ